MEGEVGEKREKRLAKLLREVISPNNQRYDGSVMWWEVDFNLQERIEKELGD